jgi:hypothetical protein
MGHASGPLRLDRPHSGSDRQLGWTDDFQVQELTELARLLKSGMITPDEYEKAKQKIFS